MKHFIPFLFFALLFSCKNENDMKEDQSTNIAYSEDNTPTDFEAEYTEQAIWSNDASIYEVNIRQFSEEGSFNAVTDQLERIKNMGIEIIWLMPIHPISKEKRKESADDLGSYYAVGDFRAVNPNYGTMEDFEELIAKAHELDMKVILDWVPNHTGWDHPWINEHPEYYTQVDGEIVDPINPDTGESWGWTDVADLNYDNEEMRKAMISDMAFWVKEKNVDGFRCDVAHGVPVDFWNDAVKQLRSIKGEDLFMLAEAENPELAGLFNMSYGWGFHHELHKVLNGEEEFTKLEESVANFQERFGSNHYAMMFTTNHDENSWAGTVFERYGDAHQAMAVLTFTIHGMPLIYSGQEAAMDKQLEFFTKDAIDWKNYPLQDFYTQLLQLKKDNPALWNGDFGGELKVMPIDESNSVYTYLRQKEKNKVFVAINFSDSQAGFEWPFERDGSWELVMGDILPDDGATNLAEYGYAVWVKNE